MADAAEAAVTPQGRPRLPPRPLLATLLVLVAVGVGAAFTIPRASGKLSATATNTSTYAASSCYLPVPVSMVSGNNFSPASLTIKAGCYVKWTNTVSQTHTTTNTLPSLGSIWDSLDMTQGNVYQRQFLTTGSFPYKCTKHASMTGTVTVN
jgi:plastocyanin